MRLSPKLPRSVQINKGGNFYGSPLNHYRQLGCCFLLNFYSMRIEWVNQVIVVAKIFGSSLILKLLNGHVILYKPMTRQKNNSQILTVQSKNKTTGKHLACKIFFRRKNFKISFIQSIYNGLKFFQILIFTHLRFHETSICIRFSELYNYFDKKCIKHLNFSSGLCCVP